MELPFDKKRCLVPLCFYSLMSGRGCTVSKPLRTHSICRTLHDSMQLFWQFTQQIASQAPNDSIISILATSYSKWYWSRCFLVSSYPEFCALELLQPSVTVVLFRSESWNWPSSYKSRGSRQGYGWGAPLKNIAGEHLSFCSFQWHPPCLY